MGGPICGIGICWWSYWWVSVERERDIVGEGDRLVLAQTKAAQTILFNITSKLLKYMILFDIRWLGLVR